MAKRTDHTRAQLAEGLGALFVIVIGLVGIPLALALVIGWPLPHHLPTTTQLHSAAGSQIPDDFWPKALATIAWIAWACFRLLPCQRNNRRHSLPSPRDVAPSAGKSSMAALVAAVFVLASIRGSVGADRTTPAMAAVANLAPTADTTAPSSRPATLTYTVIPGDSLYGVALNHYGDGEQWHVSMPPMSEFANPTGGRWIQLTGSIPGGSSPSPML